MRVKEALMEVKLFSCAYERMASTSVCLLEIKSHSVAQDGLELVVILLPQPLECWDHRYEPPQPSESAFLDKHKGIGKQGLEVC